MADEALDETPRDLVLEHLFGVLNNGLSDSEADVARDAAMRESRIWAGSQDYHSAVAAIVVSALKAVAVYRRTSGS